MQPVHCESVCARESHEQNAVQSIHQGREFLYTSCSALTDYTLLVTLQVQSLSPSLIIQLCSVSVSGSQCSENQISDWVIFVYGDFLLFLHRSLFQLWIRKCCVAFLAAPQEYAASVYISILLLSLVHFLWENPSNSKLILECRSSPVQCCIRMIL